MIASRDRSIEKPRCSRTSVKCCRRVCSRRASRMGTRERTSTEDRFRTLRHICSLASHVVMSHSPICLHSIGHTRLELTLRLTRRRSAARRSRVRLHRHFRRSGSQTPALDLDLNSGKGQSVGDSPRDPAPLPTRSAQRNFTEMLDRVSKPEWQYEELPAAIRFLQPLTMARSVPRNYSHHVGTPWTRARR